MWQQHTLDQNLIYGNPLLRLMCHSRQLFKGRSGQQPIA